LRTDPVEIFERVERGGLGRIPVEWTAESSACVVLAARGYPARPATGARIEGLERAAKHQGALIFHAGTSRSLAGEWLTAGGRVLGITATGKTLDRALLRCYDAVGEIHWDGMQYRRDIGRFLE
jgi:phosphoribosylamine--glycine ligase